MSKGFDRCKISTFLVENEEGDEAVDHEMDLSMPSNPIQSRSKFQNTSQLPFVFYFNRCPFTGCKVVVASRKFDRLSQAAEEMKKSLPEDTTADIKAIQCNIRKEDEVGR